MDVYEGGREGRQLATRPWIDRQPQGGGQASQMPRFSPRSGLTTSNRGRGSVDITLLSSARYPQNPVNVRTRPAAHPPLGWSDRGGAITTIFVLARIMKMESNFLDIAEIASIGHCCEMNRKTIMISCRPNVFSICIIFFELTYATCIFVF